MKEFGKKLSLLDISGFLLCLGLEFDDLGVIIKVSLRKLIVYVL